MASPSHNVGGKYINPRAFWNTVRDPKAAFQRTRQRTQMIEALPGPGIAKHLAFNSESPLVRRLAQQHLPQIFGANNTFAFA